MTISWLRLWDTLVGTNVKVLNLLLNDWIETSLVLPSSSLLSSSSSSSSPLLPSSSPSPLHLKVKIGGPAVLFWIGSTDLHDDRFAQKLGSNFFSLLSAQKSSPTSFLEKLPSTQSTSLRKRHTWSLVGLALLPWLSQLAPCSMFIEISQLSADTCQPYHMISAAPRKLLKLGPLALHLIYIIAGFNCIAKLVAPQREWFSNRYFIHSPWWGGL